MPSRLILIRHALSAVDPNVDSRQWGLAPGAREEAQRLATQLPDDIGDTIWTSSERKAIETARAIADVRGLRVEIDERFGEVERPWTDGADDYRNLALGYLAGDVPDGWEHPDDIARRFTDAVTALPRADSTVIVDHGLALSLYTASVAAIDVRAFWAALTFPDAWLLDLDAGDLSRVYRAADGHT